MLSRCQRAEHTVRHRWCRISIHTASENRCFYSAPQSINQPPHADLFPLLGLKLQTSVCQFMWMITDICLIVLETLMYTIYHPTNVTLSSSRSCGIIISNDRHSLFVPLLSRSCYPLCGSAFAIDFPQIAVIDVRCFLAWLAGTAVIAIGTLA